MNETQFLSQLKTADLFEGRRYDNAVLAEWNNSQTHCAICGDEVERCENSHTVKKGRAGAAASQVYALPLCHGCHSEYEDTNIDIYLANHPNLFEIVTRNIERQFDHFTGESKPTPRKPKVGQKKVVRSDFKESKFNPRMEYCRHCKRVTAKSEKENKHTEECVTLIKEK